MFDSLFLLNRVEEDSNVIPPRIIEGNKKLGISYSRVGGATKAFDLAEYKNRFHSIKVIENDTIAIDVRIDINDDLEEELILGVIDEF